MAQLRRRSFLTAVGVAAAVVGACSRRSEPTSAPPSTTPTGTPSPSSTPPSPSATPSPTPSGPTLPPGVVNVLVVGSDRRGTGDVRSGNSDVIIVVQLTADRKRLNMVSIPRDTLATFPNGGRGKINAIYPQWGPLSLSAAVSQLLGGLEIHHVMEIGFVGFRKVVLLLENVVVVNKYFSDTEGFRFEIGPVTLPLERQALGALWFCRERKTLPNGDLDRTERQRATLTGFMLRLGELARTNEQQLRDLLPALWRCLRPGGTVTAELAASLIDDVKTMTADSVASVILPISGYGMVGGASVDHVNEARAAELAAGLAAADLGPYIAAYGTSNATTG